MTAPRIAEHSFPEVGPCVHCGVDQAEREKSCIFRDAPPRAVPVSVFHDLGEIGIRMRAIKAEEGRAE